jgi:hypothetical protein
MEIESLAGLKAAFEEWRSKKRHPREAVPADLLDRARRGARRHGPAAVARATKVERSRLETGSPSRRESRAAPGVPTFSRVELAAPLMAPLPFVEVEMPTGLKVRLFTQSDEALEVLSLLCSTGGTR